VGAAAIVPDRVQTPPLGGRFIGVWLAVIAFAAGWTAVRPWEEGRTTAFAVTAFLGGALVAALRTYGQLESGQRTGYAAVIVVALVVSLAVLVAGGRSVVRSANR